MAEKENLAARFKRARPRLLAVANRLLSSDADAQDAVQEAWLRLERTDARAIVKLEAWLTTVVPRVGLDMLLAPRRTREHSQQVEPRADEPLALGGDPAEEDKRSDQLGVALLVVLETLSPAERVALILNASEILESADLVFTGEGRLDSQSLHGKVVNGVPWRAARRPT